MRILIVGNDPNEIGGVANYTRPLATKYAEMGHDVFYLYSGAYASKYNMRFRPYIKRNRNNFPFECAELFNSSCLPFNYGHPQRDISMPDMDEVINDYLNNIKPDVMHVHSRLGLPFSINRLASNLGISVINTIHVYGYICQKRVMIDHLGEPCRGPFDLVKCSICTGKQDIAAEFRRARIRSFKEFVKARSGVLYGLMQRTKRTSKIDWSPGVVRNDISTTERSADPVLAELLRTRLEAGQETLNRFSDLTICVSNDVRQTLKSFGVNEAKLHVQHIGSTIAERQKQSDQSLCEPIVIGNIGGVNYYKGTHVFLDAIARLNRSDFRVKIFGKYDENYVAKLMKGRESLPIEFTGRYHPDELPKILKQIDIMVLPSICNDTAPQTIFESFSGGVPIIASNIGGFPDFIDHDANGLLFEPGNSEDLAAKIDYILDNPDRIYAYKKNIPKLKTISENAAELIALYGNLFSNRTL
ncbi:MAG: glycosyltransferase [Desulfuromonadaceae bacterium]